MNYPLEQLHDVVTELGTPFANSETYDELFDLLTEQIEQRRGEGEAGQAFLERGIQKLRAGLPYDAIRFFGRAQEKLAKREYRSNLVAALLACGSAYEDAGLLWAARASVLSGASFALNEFWERGEIVKAALLAVAKLVWLELRLGRVPDVLAWIQLGDVLKRHLEAAEGPDSDIREQRQMQDMVLGLLLLSSDLTQLAQLDFLPGILDRLDLSSSQMTLLYALGYEQRLVDDGWLPKGQTLDDLQNLYEKMPDQPASEDLPDKPQLMGDSQVKFKSRVLGCEVEVETRNELPSIQLAEAVISALEAFLATSLKTGVFPHRDKIAISIHPIPGTIDVPRYEAGEGGSLGIKIFHSTPVYVGTVEGQKKFSEWMQELVLQVVVHIAVISDPEAYMERIAGVERAFGRAINNAYFGVFIGNILGDEPMLRLSDWSRGFSGERFPLQRSSPWREKKPEEVSLETYTSTSTARGEPPEGLFDAERGTHSDIKVVSLIDLPLWNKAGWLATVYAAFPSGPPVLALGFRDREQGMLIFRGWRERLGAIDTKEELRISIIRGIDKANPAAYRVVVSSQVPAGPGKMFVMTSRINTMQPRTTRHLERFLSDFAGAGRYMLAPAEIEDEAATPKIVMDLWIGKTKLEVRHLWEIGDNDPDLMSVRSDDDPIIPEGMKDAPIHGALERVRKWKGRSNQD